MSTLKVNTIQNTAAAAYPFIKQIVVGTHDTQVDVNSTTLTDTGLTATITPKTTASKILVLISQSVDHNSRSVGRLVCLRGATTIFDAINVGDADNQRSYHFIPVLDSPSSTSSLTYKTQMSRFDQSGTINIQRNDTSKGKSTIVLIEVAA